MSIGIRVGSLYGMRAMKDAIEKATNNNQRSRMSQRFKGKCSKCGKVKEVEVKTHGILLCDDCDTKLDKKYKKEQKKKK